MGLNILGNPKTWTWRTKYG